MAVPRWYPTVMTTSQGGLAASGIDRLTDPSTHQPPMESYDSTGNAWTTVPGGDNTLPLYSRLFDVPSGPLKGQLYYETGGTLWGPFGEHPQEAAWNLAQVHDPATQAWRILGPSVFGARQSPNNVMLPLDRPMATQRVSSAFPARFSAAFSPPTRRSSPTFSSTHPRTSLSRLFTRLAGSRAASYSLMAKCSPSAARFTTT